MTDEILLFLVLALIYVTDSGLFIPLHSIAFMTWIGSRWRLTFPSQLFRGMNTGLIVPNLIPPLGQIFCCHLLPLSISPRGICSYNYQTHTDSTPPENVVSVLFEDITAVRATSENVLINETAFSKFRDREIAAKVVNLITNLRESSPEVRGALIEAFYEEDYGLETARDRLNTHRNDLLNIKLTCNTLFLWLFVFAPLLVLYFQRTMLLIPLGLGMIAAAIIIALEYYHVHRKLYLTSKEERVTTLIKMILCPPVAIRACDLLTMNLLGNYNPIVVGNLLFSEDKFKVFVASILRNLEFNPARGMLNTVAQTICDWQNQILLGKINQYLSDMGLARDDLLSPPKPIDTDVRAYCPRCLAQYTHEAGECPDCLGVTLIPFEASDKHNFLKVA